MQKGIVAEYDEWGPELVLKVYDPSLGMKGFLVIDNTKLGLGKGGLRKQSTNRTM